MSGLQFLLLILAASPPESTADDVRVLFAEGFEAEADRDFDEKPDRWTRLRKPGFPVYLQSTITAKEAAQGSSCLEMRMDGGAIALNSPSVEAVPGLDYVLECSVKTDGLVRDAAFIVLEAYNQDRRLVEKHASSKIGGTTNWTRVRLGPLTLASPDIAAVQVGLHVEHAGRPDLRGRVLFDDVRLTRLPRIGLELSPRATLYAVGTIVEVACHVAGDSAAGADIAFKLVDETGQNIDAKELPLEKVETIESERSSQSTAVWRLSLARPGFYRVFAQMRSGKKLAAERDLTLAVAAPIERPQAGEFGWTLHDGEGTLKLDTIGEVATEAGAHWLKIPLWTAQSPSDIARVDALNSFLGRFDAQGLGAVGILQPPSDPDAQASASANEPRSKVKTPRGAESEPEADRTAMAARFFSQPDDLWFAPIEAAMARLTLKVRTWQLGADHDSSLSEIAGFDARMSEIKSRLRQVDQDAQAGTCGVWGGQTTGDSAACDFLTLFVRSATPPEEIAARLAQPRPAGGKLWLTLEALEAKDRTVEERAADLIRRMVAAKAGGADKIFFANPISDNRGLLRDDGSATELLIPWRTAALFLAGAAYVGTVDLPGGSPNAVFSRNGNALMVVWNSQPRRETLYLGSDPRQTDMWGRESPLSIEGAEQAVAVGPTPVFITGLNEAAARWRTDFAFVQDTLASTYGTAMPNGFRVESSFRHDVNVKVRMTPPADWKFSQREFEFSLAPGEKIERPFDITLPLGASHGPQPVRLEFEIVGQQTIAFAMVRKLVLGTGDLVLEAKTSLDPRGQMLVEQRMANRGSTALRFRCHLAIPARRRLRKNVVVPPNGEIVTVYRVPNGQELVGKRMLIHAEEFGGANMLNLTVIGRE